MDVGEKAQIIAMHSILNLIDNLPLIGIEVEIEQQAKSKSSTS